METLPSPNSFNRQNVGIVYAMLLEPSIASFEEHLSPNGRPVLYLRLSGLVLRSPSALQKPLDTGISEVLQAKNLSIEQIKAGNSGIS